MKNLTAEEEFKRIFDEMGLEEVFAGGRDEASMKVGSRKIDEFCRRLGKIKPVRRSRVRRGLKQTDV